jgi:hypothetical protein
MLHELTAGEYAVFEQHLRAPKDAYMLRKTQKDRKKLKIWLNAILATRDVIIFYKDGDSEIMKIISKRLENVETPDAPVGAETVGYETYVVMHYLLCHDVFSKSPLAIPIDSITKFVCSSDGLVDLSNTILWHDHGYY